MEEVETFVNSLLSEWCINECFAVVEENAYGLHFDKAVAATKEGVGKAVAATTAAAATAVTVVGSQWSAVSCARSRIDSTSAARNRKADWLAGSKRAFKTIKPSRIAQLRRNR